MLANDRLGTADLRLGLTSPKGMEEEEEVVGNRPGAHRMWGTSQQGPEGTSEALEAQFAIYIYEFFMGGRGVVELILAK